MQRSIPCFPPIGWRRQHRPGFSAGFAARPAEWPSVAFQFLHALAARFATPQQFRQAGWRGVRGRESKRRTDIEAKTPFLHTQADGPVWSL
jgi:hypothetical protein